MTSINKYIQILIVMFIALTLLSAVNIPIANGDETQSGWTTLAPMPTARGDFGVAVVGGKIYAIGGLNRENQPVNTLEVYNPQTNEWTTRIPMPTPRSGFATVVYQNKIYVIGGTVGNGYVGNTEVYDSVSNTWETKASMPTPRAELCANLVNDKMYLIGGKKYSSTSPFNTVTNINEVYDPANDSWSIKTPVPTSVQGYASAIVENKIYVLGGSLDSSLIENTVLTGANQMYDTQNNTWSSAAKLPSAVSYGTAAKTEGFMAPATIYYIGGFSNGEFSSQVQAYNLTKNAWSNVESMPTPRAFLGIAVINDVIFAIGGFDGANWVAVNEQYKPEGYGTVAPKVQITSPENKTYSEISVAFTVNRGTEWLGYSLDNQANVTIRTETILEGLREGPHNITIYANDSLGNMGASEPVYFSFDTIPPLIDIIRPQNQSYDTTEIQLTFTIDEAVTALAYSLDGQEKVPLIGNVTLPALTDGSHRLTLYATDNLGNSSQRTVSFAIAPFPMVVLVAVLALVTIALAAGYLLFKRRKSGTDKDKSKPKN